MERRNFLKTASLGMIGAAVPALERHAIAASAEPIRAAKPNIIFVVSDQHRAGLSRRAGYPLDTSPTLDALSDEGIAFDRAYATTPLCVPSRISMLT
ncbi:MAG: sulfatase-like hydrolase/transferase, partial [Acidobacteriales bacterium]|nr:sulfatase-like hydrolase/transferase [Terriglobales bacterium]